MISICITGLWSFVNLKTTISSSYTNLNVPNKHLHRGLTISFKKRLPTSVDNQCGFLHDFAGRGFYMSIHDQALSTALHFLNPFIYLTPGTATTVTLKPLIFQRHTKQLGKCRDGNYFLGKSQVWIKPKIWGITNSCDRSKHGTKQFRVI